MNVTDINIYKYTHIHFAFASITSSFAVDVSGVQDQFNRFAGMYPTTVKRIISFGGWSFSTEQDTYPIFRSGVTSDNARTFANNVAAFVSKYNLDGVDFDWEYPGATDIPGIPAGSASDGQNYLNFLKVMRSVLPAGKTISIAAPASYWYLKGFPIKEISSVVDYIVYMTYDLHGQWDYGSAWASPGCTAGNCLRSHVNMTETMTSLAMITKAGVPAAKVVVGVSSYGRSFQMTAAGCDGPMCTYVGPNSGATPGACTQTAGYISDAEIAAIKASTPGVKSWYDASSQSNMLVYNNNQWIAYMDSSNKANRTAYYKTLNFGGTTDWAVDLQSFLLNDACPAGYADCARAQYSFKSRDDVDWRSKTCTDPLVTDAAQSPSKRWYGLGCDAAWQDAVAYWQASPHRGGLSFSETISNFFHGPEGMRCEITVDNNGCSGTWTQCQGPPCGYLIMNSMIAMDSVSCAESLVYHEASAYKSFPLDDA
jgi:GH18 family chitinase